MTDAHDKDDSHIDDHRERYSEPRCEREALLRDAVQGCAIGEKEDQALTLLSHFDGDTLAPIYSIFDRLRAAGPRIPAGTGMPRVPTLLLAE